MPPAWWPRWYWRGDGGDGVGDVRSTSLSIWLVASDRPMEIDTPVLPKEAASDAAAAVAVISEVSLC